MVQGRSPVYPLMLDEAAPGESTPLNPFFVEVLADPVMRDWSKEGPFIYEGPTGRRYVYNPNRGVLELSGEDVSEVLSAPDPLGDILDTFSSIVFYSSGAIVDRSTSLAYVPDYLRDTVDLTLISGAVVTTHEDGSATIRLPDGQELYVPDIRGREVYYKIPSGEGESDLYVAVGRGQAREWESSFKTLSSDSSYDAATRTYGSVSTYQMEGRDAGGSLLTDSGFIYETTYRAEEPTTVRSTWTPLGKEGYRGTTATEFQYSSNSVYASNAAQGAERSGYGIAWGTSGETQTDYTYHAKTGLYESDYSGSYGYEYTYSTLNRDDQTFEEHLDYEGSFRQNQRNGDYDGSVRYRYRSGRDETYEYHYDHRKRTYTSVYRDNKTGEERRYETRQ